MINMRGAINKVKTLMTRNPYTGSVTLDEDGLIALLAAVWEDGYGRGFDDADSDTLVAQGGTNPYKS